APELGGQRLSLRLVAVDDRHGRARFGERADGGLAEARGPTRDERGCPLDLHGAALYAPLGNQTAPAGRRTPQPNRRWDMRRAFVAVVVVGLALVIGAGPALACGGLIGRNGAVNLGRTTTLAAYEGGVEHYVTAFEFNGAGGEFGSIVPLPGVPTNVERGGDWTLQRLVREVTPIEATDGRADLQLTGAKAATARELINTRIDALDLTVLEGG